MGGVNVEQLETDHGMQNFCKFNGSPIRDEMADTETNTIQSNCDFNAGTNM